MMVFLMKVALVVVLLVAALVPSHMSSRAAGARNGAPRHEYREPFGPIIGVTDATKATTNDVGAQLVEYGDRRCRIDTPDGETFTFSTPGFHQAHKGACMLSDLSHSLIAEEGCAINNRRLLLTADNAALEEIAPVPPPSDLQGVLIDAAPMDDIVPGVETCVLRFSPTAALTDLQRYDHELSRQSIQASAIYKDAVRAANERVISAQNRLADSESSVATINEEYAAANVNLARWMRMRRRYGRSSVSEITAEVRRLTQDISKVREDLNKCRSSIDQSNNANVTRNLVTKRDTTATLSNGVTVSLSVDRQYVEARSGRVQAVYGLSAGVPGDARRTHRVYVRSGLTACLYAIDGTLRVDLESTDTAVTGKLKGVYKLPPKAVMMQATAGAFAYRAGPPAPPALAAVEGSATLSSGERVVMAANGGAVHVQSARYLRIEPSTDAPPDTFDSGVRTAEVTIRVNEYALDGRRKTLGVVLAPGTDAGASSAWFRAYRVSPNAVFTPCPSSNENTEIQC